MQHHAQHAVDADPGVPEASVVSFRIVKTASSLRTPPASGSGRGHPSVTIGSMSPRVRKFLEDATLVLVPLAAAVAIATFVIVYVVPYGQSAVGDLRASVTTAMNQPRPPFVAAALVYAGASTTNSTSR